MKNLLGPEGWNKFLGERFKRTGHQENRHRPAAANRLLRLRAFSVESRIDCSRITASGVKLSRKRLTSSRLAAR